MKPSPGKRERGGWSGRKTRKERVRAGGGGDSAIDQMNICSKNLIFVAGCSRMFENAMGTGQ